MIYSFFLLLQFSQYFSQQWISSNTFLIDDKNLTTFSLVGTTNNYYLVCNSPQIKYFTLTKAYPTATQKNQISLEKGYHISFELILQGIWHNGLITFQFGVEIISFQYQTPTTNENFSIICDSYQAEIKTINFTLQNSGSNIIQFMMSNEGDGQVSIRNLLISKIKCHYQCTQCNGIEYNQCTQCFYGTPLNGICNECPPNTVFRTGVGCSQYCNLNEYLDFNRVCQQFSTRDILFSDYAMVEERDKMTVIQDLDNTNHIPSHMSYVGRYDLLGVFKYNQGTARLINEATSNIGTYLIGIRTVIILFNEIPCGSSISFKINDTYAGSIYNDCQQLQFHKLRLVQIDILKLYENYTNCSAYYVFILIDIPQYQFTISIVGNYILTSATWAYEHMLVTSGYCPKNCKLCELPFQCQICYPTFYKSRDGQCSLCISPYQKLNDSYCQDYDNETPYSKYLVQEYKDLTNDPNQFSQYTLISQQGINFMKGSDILYSIYNAYLIFGGELVWAQAKFSREHYIIKPHHSITIGFYILFGPSFPQDSQFIYTIGSNNPVITFKGSSQIKRVYERISHSESSLTIEWECYGPNNEPKYAYCGFYNYYIAIHYCQPYCGKCTSENDCIQWDSNYDQNIMKFSQAECNSNQYFDKNALNCFICPSSCLTCTSQLHCLTCQDSFFNSKLGCVCKTKQYEYSNYCFDCPIQCQQCASSQWCTECAQSQNRIYSNGQCYCKNGYSSFDLDPFCYKCQTHYCHVCDKVNGLQCYSCQRGYQLIENNCFSICGDGITTVNEQCDDGNLGNGDGCFACQYDCSHSCQFCHNGVCLECYDGYILIQTICYPICGLDQVYIQGHCQTIINPIQIYSVKIAQLQYSPINQMKIEIYGDVLNIKKYQCNSLTINQSASFITFKIYMQCSLDKSWHSFFEICHECDIKKTYQFEHDCQNSINFGIHYQIFIYKQVFKKEELIITQTDTDFQVFQVVFDQSYSLVNIINISLTNI